MPVQRSSKKDDSKPRTSSEGCATVVSQYFADLTPAAAAGACVRASNGQKGSTKTSLTSSNVPAIHFPTTALERDAYRTNLGKRLTLHQWDVYDFVLTIPKGKVATYKDVALSAGGSPRSVGNALRNNPFSPSVPCHRVIASNLFIGGFFGEWGKDHKTGTRCNEKLEMLAAGGVLFNDKGQLLSREDALLKLP